jgi:hypothetical protein
MDMMEGEYFEKFALNIIKNIAQKNNQQFYIGYEAGSRYQFLDGYAPNGILDISGPVAIEVKLRINSLTIEKLILRILNKLPDIKNVLLLTKEQSIDNPINKIKTKNDLHILIWDSSKLQELANDFPEISLTYSPDIDLVDNTLRKYQQSPYNLNKNILIDKLSMAYYRGELVLFIGAGVSIGTAKESENYMPDWDKLIKLLLSKTINKSSIKNYDYENISLLLKDKFDDFSSIALGRFIKKALKDNFIDSLREALYGKYLKSINKESSLYCISKLCDPPRSGIGGISAIVTYNFDDLLEFYLDNFNIKYISIIKSDQIPTEDEIPIYHVHGFLPQDSSIEIEDSIIFGEYEYHAQYSDPYSWQNLLQLNLLKEKTALFIGLSMNDPNLRRLLDISYSRYSSSQKHYAFLRDRWDIQDEVLANMLRNMEEDTFKDLGINIVWYRDRQEINEILDKITKKH